LNCLCDMAPVRLNKQQRLRGLCFNLIPMQFTRLSDADIMLPIRSRSRWSTNYRIREHGRFPLCALRLSGSPDHLPMFHCQCAHHLLVICSGALWIFRSIKRSIRISVFPLSLMRSRTARNRYCLFSCILQKMHGNELCSAESLFDQALWKYLPAIMDSRGNSLRFPVVDPLFIFHLLDAGCMDPA